MAINISDLPPKYQAQAVKKYMEQQARRGPLPSAAAVQDPGKVNKYRNTPTHTGDDIRGRSSLRQPEGGPPV